MSQRMEDGLLFPPGLGLPSADTDDAASMVHGPIQVATSAEDPMVRVVSLPNHLTSKAVMEAVLEQSNFDKYVVKFDTFPGEDRGEAFITLISSDAAEKCAQYFNGMRFDASGIPMRAEVLRTRTDTDIVCEYCEMEFDRCDIISFSCGHDFHRNCPIFPDLWREIAIRDSPCHRCWRACGRALKKRHECNIGDSQRACDRPRKQRQECNKGDSRCGYNHDEVALRFCEFESPPKTKNRLHPRKYRKYLEMKRMEELSSAEAPDFVPLEEPFAYSPNVPEFILRAVKEPEAQIEGIGQSSIAFDASTNDTSSDEITT